MDEDQFTYRLNLIEEAFVSELRSIREVKKLKSPLRRFGELTELHGRAVLIEKNLSVLLDGVASTWTTQKELP